MVVVIYIYTYTKEERRKQTSKKITEKETYMSTEHKNIREVIYTRENTHIDENEANREKKMDGRERGKHINENEGESQRERKGNRKRMPP